MPVLCACSAVPDGQAIGVAFRGRTYVVVHKDAQFYVYINRCPHLGIPLEWQPDHFLDEEGELLRCSTHGALFIVETGLCVAGPCAGDALTAAPFELKDNQIWLN